MFTEIYFFLWDEQRGSDTSSQPRGRVLRRGAVSATLMSSSELLSIFMNDPLPSGWVSFTLIHRVIVVFMVAAWGWLTGIHSYPCTTLRPAGRGGEAATASVMMLFLGLDPMIGRHPPPHPGDVNAQTLALYVLYWRLIYKWVSFNFYNGTLQDNLPFCAAY